MRIGPPLFLALSASVLVPSRADAQLLVEDVRILLPDPAGQTRFGTGALAKGVRHELATVVKEVVKAEVPSTVSDAEAAKIGAKLSVSYVLRIAVEKKGWLYTARALLIDVATSEQVMSFEVGYYKPEDDAEDRGARIGKRTLQKLALLLAPREQPTTRTATVAAPAKAGTATAIDVVKAPEGTASDPFDTGFDAGFQSGFEPVVGAAPDSAVRSERFVLAPKWSHTGRLEVRYQRFLSDSPLLEGKDRNLVTLGIRATIEGSLSPSVRVRVLPVMGVDVLNQRLYRPLLEEGYAELSLDNVALRVGWDALTWGSASTINIVDIINSRDFTEGFFESTKIGQPMVSMRLIFGESSVRFYYFSPFVEPVIPRLDSAFFPLPIPLNGPGPLAGSGRVAATTVYGSTLEEWAPEAAARLSLVIGNVDLNFSYFYGYDRFPLVDPSTVELFYALIHQVSVDGQWLADPWLLKWEVSSVTHQETSVTRSRGVPLPGHRMSWVVGVERTFEGFVGGTTFTPIAELIGDSDSVWFTDRREPDDFSRIFQNHLTLAFRWSLENRVNSEVTLSNIIDLSRPEDNVFTVVYSERWLQYFTFSIGGRFVNANAQSKIIALEQLSGFFTRLRLSY